MNRPEGPGPTGIFRAKDLATSAGVTGERRHEKHARDGAVVPIVDARAALWRLAALVALRPWQRLGLRQS
jgi:hypothetical protein